MVSIPRASTRVSRTAGAQAGGLDVCCVWSPVAQNADMKPRVFGSAAAIFDLHGFCEGVEYGDLHFGRTRKPVLFVGLPIEVPGEVSRHDTSGNTNTCVTTVTAGADGVLHEHDGELSVVTGGVIGTDQILLELSMDGGRTRRRVKLGQANSYTVPYFGVGVAFGAGSLTAGQVIHTWHGSSPRASTADMVTARQKLAAQQKQFRTILLLQDLQDSDEADAYLTQLNLYETENERFVQGRGSVKDLLPYSVMSKVRARMTGAATLTFAEVGGTGDTITRSVGSWITDGFQIGDIITVAGSASNNVTGPIVGLTATVITLGTTDLAAEGPVSNCTVTASPGLTFAEVGATGDTITRNRGSWLSDGFRVGDRITVAGSGSNNFSNALVTAVTALVLTLDTQDLTAEVVGSYGVTITAGQTKAQWAAELDAEFSGIDDSPHIDLSMGRARVFSNFSKWKLRRPASWGASIREYQHQPHVATWRKSDGILPGFDLNDADGNLVEWDDRVDGAAASAARFTSYRSWANGPEGCFITQSLTRAQEGDLAVQNHNQVVINFACSIVQRNTEDAAVGVSLILNDDGTADGSSLSTIQTRVQSALDLGLLKNTPEGPLASSAVWTPSKDDILNVPEAVLTGVLELNLNGTIHSVETSVAVKQGGQ